MSISNRIDEMVVTNTDYIHKQATELCKSLTTQVNRLEKILNKGMNPGNVQEIQTQLEYLSSLGQKALNLKADCLSVRELRQAYDIAQELEHA